MGEPTAFPELNGVLRELVASDRQILGESFVGAYLQGSFAIGDADEHSDVDFLVVVEDDVTGPQRSALQAMHERIFALAVAWAQHLEGSYVPRRLLRRVDPSRSPFLYLDNGASELILSDHCNTAVVRWSVRERGIVLAGPEPASLVDPVTSAQLRAEVRETMTEWVAWAEAPAMSRWRQPLLVLSYCRMLHTLEVGEVTSKRRAGEWALAELDPEWRPLVRRALDDRPDPWLRVHQPAAAGDVARTLAFVSYALAEADRRPSCRDMTGDRPLT